MLGFIVAGVGIVAALFVAVWVVRGVWGVGVRNEEMVAGGSQGHQTRRVKDERPE